MKLPVKALVVWADESCGPYNVDVGEIVTLVSYDAQKLTAETDKMFSWGSVGGKGFYDKRPHDLIYNNIAYIPLECEENGPVVSIKSGYSYYWVGHANGKVFALSKSTNKKAPSLPFTCLEDLLKSDIESLFCRDDLIPAPQHDYKQYFKDVSHLDEIDVYRVLELFEVRDHAIGHAVKKLLLAGVRTGGKSEEADVEEAVDTLLRWQQMREEDEEM